MLTKAKDELNHIVTRNGFLDKQKIKNKIRQLLYKYKHGNNILWTHKTVK